MSFVEVLSYKWYVLRRTYDLKLTTFKNIQVPISAVSTSSHSEQRSQARQSRWYCSNMWKSRSAPNLKVAPFSNEWGFLVLYTPVSGE